MLRLGAIFISVCIVLIAISCGAVLYFAIGLSGAESTLIALVVLTGLALYNAVTSRLRGRSDLGTQIADLSRGTADLSRQVAELGRRLAVLEGTGDRSADKVRAATAPLAAELGELGTLVNQLAESVAMHEVALTSNKLAAVNAASAPAAMPAAAPAVTPVRAVEPEPRPTLDEAVSAKRAAMAATIRDAIEANRVDLYLQPMVTLPQRKVRYYEALTRLRTDDGTILAPSDFLEPAETAGLLPRIDNLLLFRSVQVVRRLLLKNRDVGLFCNISAVTLNDPHLFPQMVQFMEANRALAASLVLEIRQSTWRTMGLLEQESLATLRELGFRFCMDRVSDLRIEPKELGEHGVRFVKVPAPLLLGHGNNVSSDIHAADLADLLNRFGISLIADTIESESQVVDLLDYDLPFGQGMLFSPPRPVRAEALQGVGDDSPAAPAAAAR
jgi:cyclic-di-GMP phosphodiesterase TipF (flagellum assembly factor)